MKYSPILIIHILGGMIGMLSGSIAIVARKGARLNRKSGDVFVISMLVMAAAGGYAALLKSQTSNVIGGAFTFYLVASAWLTVARKDHETGRLEFALLLLGLATGISSLVYGWKAMHSPLDSNAGVLVVPSFVCGGIAVLSTAGDIRMLIRGGVSGAKRLLRHLWRMCLALFVAVASFFLGTASDPVLGRTGLRATLFTPAIRHTHLPEVPVLLVVVVTVFWVCKVWFGTTYRASHSTLAHLQTNGD